MRTASRLLYDPPVRAEQSESPKYKQIYDAMKAGIDSGAYQKGQRLPSELELGRKFGASRLTVNRALRELQLGGLIDRRAGSGSYVSDAAEADYTFGLLIPELGLTEIFEPICRGMAEVTLEQPHVLLWGKSPTHSADVERHAYESCGQWIAKKVSGVFFAPLEYAPGKDAVNLRIAELLSEAGIPIVLIDRDIVPFPARSRHDVVSIDNRRAAYVLTRHVLDAGARHVVFVGRHDAAPSCVARSAGFRDAMQDGGLWTAGSIHHINPTDPAEIHRVIADGRIDGIVCSNDFTAAHVMRALEAMGRRVPTDVRVAGFDDVKYASLLPVPLTTIHQPCAQLGEAAVRMMVERLKNPVMAARDVLLSFELVIRSSTAAG
jgi:GntR family transcriptional regulator, arabinose operon transcriptional repressor